MGDKEYWYEVWNGKEVLGYYKTSNPIPGNHLVLPYKTSNGKVKTFTIPITYLFLNDTGLPPTFRVVLDVRRKSKRQINLLLGKQ